jgi:hypothetical protein
MTDRKKQTQPQLYLNSDEFAKLNAAILSGDGSTVDRYHNLIQKRKTAQSQQAVQGRENLRDTRKNIVGYLLVGLGFLAFIIFVVPRIESANPGGEPTQDQAQVQTSGPCDDSEKDGAIGDMAVGATGWTTSWTLAHDESGYWVNPAGTVFGPPTGEIHICVLRTASEYEVWMDPSEISGERKENWLPIKLHPES